MEVRIIKATKSCWYFEHLFQDVEVKYVCGEAVTWDDKTIPASDFEIVRTSSDVETWDRGKREKAAELAATLKNKNVTELLSNAGIIYNFLVARVEKIKDYAKD